MSATGTLYIIAAPSGAGKTSLVNGLLDGTTDIEVSISHTTRSVRPGERDGVHYYFVSEQTFQELIRAGQFLEYARVFDYHYGTTRQAVLEKLQTGIDVILEIDWQGARQVRSLLPECRSIFILPPSLASLRQRLRDRGQDSEAVISKRMATAVREMSHYEEFDYLLINDEFDTTLAELRAIFIANRQRRDIQLIRQKTLLKTLLSDSVS